MAGNNFLELGLQGQGRNSGLPRISPNARFNHFAINEDGLGGNQGGLGALGCGRRAVAIYFDYRCVAKNCQIILVKNAV